MHKRLFYFIVFLITFGNCFGQANISIQFNTPQNYKTVIIQGYQADTSYYTLSTLPYSKTLVFKNKTALNPGMYFILCDSSMTGAFILSSSKNQNFNVTIGEQEIQFSGSPENEQYALYLKQMHNFEQQMGALNREYQDAQRSMPQYMLKTLVDSLNVKAKRIQKAQKEYQAQMAATNKGTLLASIIRTSTEIQTPPEDIINNRYKMMEYYDIPDWHPFEEEYIRKSLSVPYGIERIRATMNEIWRYSYPKYDFPIGGGHLLYYTQYDTATRKSHLQYAYLDPSGNTCLFQKKDTCRDVYGGERFPFLLFESDMDKARISWNDLLLEICAESAVRMIVFRKVFPERVIEFEA